MNLSNEIVLGLAVCADDKAFPVEIYKSLVEAVFTVLKTGEIDSDLFHKKFMASPIFSQVDSILLKQAYSGMISFSFEAAKQNADPLMLKGKLEEAKIVGEKANIYLEVFTKKKSEIRDNLGSTTFHFPQVIAVDWRLDYRLKSDTVEKIDEPSFVVQLTTKEYGGELKDIEFSCNIEQLQDLVSKLKDASKQIERVALKSN